MRIAEVLTVPVRAGFFSDDQAAIRAGADLDGAYYPGAPVTPGFATIRQPGEALSVMLILDDGQVACGDCASVQYPGVAGRAEPFRAVTARTTINRIVRPVLIGASVDSFRPLAEQLDGLGDAAGPLHAAIRYGLTQAVLEAVAQTQRVTMAEVVREEYRTGVELAPVPLFVQSGDDRYGNADKMILKQADILPHGLINNVASKLGRQGELLLQYACWLRDRILRLGPAGYQPTLHFDLYGTVGQAFHGDIEGIATYLRRLEQVAQPFKVRVEQVIDGGSREGQITVSAALRETLRREGSTVQVVVDEWCNTLQDIFQFVAARAADVIHVKTPDLGGVNNTIEALLHVRASGLAAYCGGTCNETDRSARVSAHIAMACGAEQILAKPGMGVDEGMMIVGNEMARTAVLAGWRSQAHRANRPTPDGGHRA